MADGGGVDGRDEPARGPNDHSELLSELDSHDLAVATDPEAPGDDDVFTVDADASPDDTFPQSIASGGPTPEGVILWARIAPDAEREVVVAYRVPEGVVQLEDVTDRYTT